MPGTGAGANALGALAVGRAFKISDRKIASGLSRVKVPENRMQIRTVRGMKVVFDCYNANPDSLQNALTLFQKENSSRKIAVLGDMAELGKDRVKYHQNAGRMVKRCGFTVLITIGRLGREIAKGAKKAGMKDCFSFLSLDPLLKIIRKLIKRGDLVLVKGSRVMKMEKILEKLALPIT